MTDLSSEAVDAAIQAHRPVSLQVQLQSDHIDKISAALSKAQAEMTTAIYNQTNPHFKSKYADLYSVRHATMRYLSANGIILTQQSTFIGEQFVLVTQLSLGDQFLRDIQPLLIALDKPQVMKSQRTYARRAGWESITGIATGEDDDGNKGTVNATVLPSQLDELMDLTKRRKIDMPVFLDYASTHLGYQIENLSMVRRADIGKIVSFMSRKKEEVK